MTLWQTSLTCRLAVWLCNVYEDSTVHRILAALGRWCNGQIEGSRVLRPLCREGVVARAWRESLLCRCLSTLVNLPGTLLHKWYQAWNVTFEDSFFARLAFDMGDNAAIAQFWCIALLWCIPYERWNNVYSFLTGILLLLLFYAGAMRTGRRLDVARIGFYPLVMIASAVLAVVFSYAPALSGRFLLYHVSAALLVVDTVSTVRSSDDLKRLCAGAAVCVGVTGACGIVQRLQGVEVNASYVDLKVNAGMPGRVYSVFDNPNTFAQVLLLLLPLVLALFLTAKRWQWKIIAAGIFCIGGVAMAMTYSRASWVGLACTMAVFVFLWKPKLIPAFALLCLLAIPFLPATVLNRILTITNTADSSTSSRVSLYRAAIEVIRRSPLTGAGLGTAATQEYIREFNLYHDKAPFVHAHNFYLEVWIQMGLMGVVGFVGSMLWNIKNAARAARHSGPSAARTIAVAAASALCGTMVCGLADFLWNYPRVLCIFWFTFAMAIAAVKVCTQEAERDGDVSDR